MRGFAFSLLSFLFALFLSCAASATTADEVKTYGLGGYYDRVKLRDAPGTDGGILGQYYANVIFEILEDRGEWKRVRVGNQEGFMMSEFLLAEVDAYALLSQGLSGMVHFPDTDGTLPLYEKPDASSAVVSHVQGYVCVLGTVGHDWLHIIQTTEQGENIYGFAASDAITHTDNLAMVAVNTGDPAQKLNLRAGPSKDTEVLGQYFCGAEGYWMFDHHTNDDGWEKVRIGDAVGYMATESLAFNPGPAAMFIPPLSMAKEQEIPIYAAAEARKPHGTVSRGEAFSVLGMRGERYFIRIETASLYRYEYAYVDKTKVKKVSRSAEGTGRLKAEQPLFCLDHNNAYVPLGKTAPKGARVAIQGSYDTDGIQRTAGYLNPSMEWVLCTVEVEPYESIAMCFVPTSAVEFDELLAYPDSCQSE